jgi:hypothetical protein
VVDELSPDDLENIKSKQVDEAVAKAMSYARENGNRAAGAIASVAYRRALQSLWAEAST